MDAALYPQLATAGERVPEIGDWSIEPKIDGWRGVMHRTADDQVRLYGGRNGSDYSGQVPEIEEQVRNLLPLDSVIDGELTGQTGWGDVQSVMTSRGTSAAARLGVIYTVFDVLRVGGEDARKLPQRLRRQLLEGIDFDQADRVCLIPSGPASQDKHDQLVALGAEGSVCKRQDATYSSGRSRSWVKIKVKASIEAVVVGFKPGSRGTRWEGKVGAFEVETLPDRVATTVKCGTDECHEDVYQRPDRWLGTVIEVEHNGLGATGVPRHPRFIRRREDRTTAPAEAIPVPTPAPNPGRKEVRRLAPSRRNYGAMKDEKLLKVIGELQDGGDAARRASDKGFDPAEDLQIAREIAESRGL